MENKTLALIFLIAGILVGCIFLIIGIVLIKDAIKKAKKCTLRVTAKVKDLKKVESIDSHVDSNNSVYYSYYPTFEYTIGEQTITQTSQNGMAKPKYTIGQEVELCCNPENYKEYYIFGDTMQKTVGIILCIVGVILLGICGSLLKFLI